MPCLRASLKGVKFLIAVILSGLAFSATASECGRHGIHGSYGVKFDGFSKNLGRFASVSIWTFTVKGGLTASESFSSENFGPDKRDVTGSYVMKSNCSFKLLFQSTLGGKHEVAGECVLVDSGREFYCLDVEAGWVATAVGKKM